MSSIQSGPMPRPWEQRIAEPPSIERQMLLAQFAAQAIKLYVGEINCTVEEIAGGCFKIADAMLAEFDKRVKR